MGSAPHNNNQLRAIMFADVSGSSALYKRVGNQKAKSMIDDAIARMRTLTESNGGTVVKTIGDEVMARFETPQSASEAAIAIQQQCTLYAVGDSLSIRIGLSYGPTLLDSGDVFGDTVNDAAFVSHIAQGGQVVLTQGMAEALPTPYLALCQEFDRVALKGAHEKSTLYRLQWENPAEPHNATTVMSIEDITQLHQLQQLRLKFDGKSTTLTPAKTPYLIGRDQRVVDLHINSGVASREHCKIVFRRGKFVLVDHSTNGTYVSMSDQKELYLRREELPLVDEGIISIGQTCNEAEQPIIQFFFDSILT